MDGRTDGWMDVFWSDLGIVYLFTFIGTSRSCLVTQLGEGPILIN